MSAQIIPIAQHLGRGRKVFRVVKGVAHGLCGYNGGKGKVVDAMPFPPPKRNSGARDFEFIGLRGPEVARVLARGRDRAVYYDMRDADVLRNLRAFGAFEGLLAAHRALRQQQQKGQPHDRY